MMHLAAREAAKKPDHINVLIDYAHRLSEFSRKQEALALIGHAMELEPENPRVWRVKAMVLMSMGQVEDSLKCWKRCLWAPNDGSGDYLDLAKTLYEMGRYADALALIRRGSDKVFEDIFDVETAKNLMMKCARRLRENGAQGDCGIVMMRNAPRYVEFYRIAEDQVRPVTRYQLSEHTIYSCEDGDWVDGKRTDTPIVNRLFACDDQARVAVFNIRRGHLRVDHLETGERVTSPVPVPVHPHTVFFHQQSVFLLGPAPHPLLLEFDLTRRKWKHQVLSEALREQNRLLDRRLADVDERLTLGDLSFPRYILWYASRKAAALPSKKRMRQSKGFFWVQWGNAEKSAANFLKLNPDNRVLICGELLLLYESRRNAVMIVRGFNPIIQGIVPTQFLFKTPEEALADFEKRAAGMRRGMERKKGLNS